MGMGIDRVNLSVSAPLELRKSVTSPTSAPVQGGTSPDFGKLVADGVQSVNKELTTASRLSRDYMTGQGKHSLHEVIIAMESADVSFRYMAEVRNKVLDAYNEVMRMQV